MEFINILLFLAMIFGGFMLIFLPIGIYKDYERNKQILQQSQNSCLSLYGFQMLTKTYLNLKEELFLQHLDNLDPVVKLFLESENFNINDFSNSKNNFFVKSKLEKKVLELVGKYCNENFAYPLFWFQPYIISYLIDDIDPQKKTLTNNQITTLKDKFNDIEFKKIYTSSVSFKDYMSKKLESINDESEKNVIKKIILDVEGYEKAFYSSH